MNVIFKSHRKPLVWAAASLVILSGCAGLGSMEKEIEALGLEASPEPLILRGDVVELTVTGKFPPKYFAKKVKMEATPILTWDGGSASFAPQGFQGEAAAGNFTVVPFENGKSFTYSAEIPFEEGMEDAGTLAISISGSQGSKEATFDPYVIGSGVITTPRWVQPEDRFILVPDAFERVLTFTQEATINYTVNNASVRSSELRDADWKALLELIDLSLSADSVTMTGCRIEAYASPEGEISLNENLASERAETASAAFANEMKRRKTALVEGFFQLVPKGEDWDGFKTLVSASSISDKDLILRVLSMYTDKNKREQEIRNIAKTYKEIENTVLPELRRSRMVVTYEVEGYTDEELMDLCKSNPDILTVEELLFAATLFSDLNDKLVVYQTTSRVHAEDFRGFNNAGWCLMAMGRMNQAKEQFTQALSIQRHKAVLNNLGAIKRLEGDIDGAMALLNEAAGAGSEVAFNKGIILIQKGDYGSALSNMGRENTVNVALAKLLNGDAAGAKTVLENAEDDGAVASYIMAIACARLNDGAGVQTHLTDALSKDGSLRSKAERDLEFRNFRDQLGF